MLEQRLQVAKQPAVAGGRPGQGLQGRSKVGRMAKGGLGGAVPQGKRAVQAAGAASAGIQLYLRRVEARKVKGLAVQAELRAVALHEAGGRLVHACAGGRGSGGRRWAT